MPLVTINLIENVFSAEQKAEMIEKITNTMVEIEGENMRQVTWVKIEEVPEGQWGIGGAALTAAMAEEHAQRRRLLALDGELGPEACDRLVEGELAPFHEREHEHRRHALADGVGVDEGVALPGKGAGLVAMAAPEIDDGTTVDDHAERAADLVANREVLAEGGLDGAEGGVAMTLDGRRRDARRKSGLGRRGFHRRCGLPRSRRGGADRDG